MRKATRPRRLRADARIDRLTVLFLGTCGALGYLAAFAVLVRRPYFEANPWHLPLLGACLYLLPFTHGTIGTRQGGWLGRLLEWLCLAAQLAVLAALGLLGFVELCLGTVTLLLGHQLVRVDSGARAYAAVLGALVLVHTGLGLAPGRLSLTLFVAAFPATALALACLVSRQTRRRGQRVRPERAHPPERDGALLGRVVWALLVATVVLLVALLTHHFTNVPPTTRSDQQAKRDSNDPGRLEERPEGEQPADRQPTQTNPSDPGREQPIEPDDRPPSDDVDDQQDDLGDDDPDDPLDQDPATGMDAPPPAGPRPPRDPSTSPPEPDPTLMQLLESMIRPGAPDVRYVSIPDYVEPVMRGIVDTSERSPWKWILAIATQVLLILWLLRRRLRRAIDRVVAAVLRESASDFYFEKLLRVLESYGHKKPAAQTPREFTRSVVRARGLLFAPCDYVTDLLYHSRYGGHELTRDERREIETIILKLERRELAPQAAGRR